MEPIISLRRVAKGHGTGRHFVNVLKDFDLEVQSGEFVALIGPSGSGKTTLLNLIGGLDPPDRGEIIVASTHLESQSSRELAAWRARHVGFVFQSFNLLDMLSAAENVELPLFLQPLGRAERRRRVQDALRQVGLFDRVSHKPGALSGGEQQRVGIARAIVAGAPILLLDEPTSGLDRATAAGILELLQISQAQTGKTILLVTHDPEAAGYANRKISLKKASSLPPEERVA